MKERVVFISHCILNKYSKVKYVGKKKIYQEKEKKDLLKYFIENDIGIIQMPCPELGCYGMKRWGHVKDQFDTSHYRKYCRDLFKPYLDQIKEYIKNDYEVIGIIGIEGSPTCGVSKTCVGNWYGELSSNEYLEDIISTIKESKESGVAIEEIKTMLKEENLDINILGLNEKNINEIYNLIR